MFFCVNEQKGNNLYKPEVDTLVPFKYKGGDWFNLKS